MKFKIISLVLIVLIAQTHFAQGTVSFGAVTGAISGSLGKITNAVNSTVIKVGDAIDKVGATIGTVTVNTTKSVVADATILLNNTVNYVDSTVAALMNIKLNAVEDVIADLSKGALSNIPSNILSPVIDAIANLTNVSQVVLQKLENLISGFPEELVQLLLTLENITAISPPEIGILSELQNILNSTGSDIMSPIVNAIEHEVEDISNIIVPLTNVTTAALDAVLSTTTKDTEILADGIDMLNNTVTGIPAAVKSAFKPLTNLLIEATTNCTNEISNQILKVIDDFTKNVTLCISTEYETLENQFTQLEDLAQKLEDDKANGAAKASNMMDLLQLAASISTTVSVTGYKIVICGRVQAGFLVSNIVTLVSSVISSTDSCTSLVLLN